MGERTLEIFARLVLTMDMLILLNWETCQELTPEVLLWGLVSIVNWANLYICPLEYNREVYWGKRIIEGTTMESPKEEQN